ncbi:Uncharacterised protein [Salmonella enterica subsp. enterica serovar Bovismorbificans]|uniref:Uncharacterized protein n=1 Tax=Salmonella enterica subsp. enterica serovar Bovismorbificans TaxID=58097 RepID=A0A655BKS7_SALET|nr:Uncharacterised protein [Salmonella enterica subsp. enterica serovar Bovismorbificans]CPR55227.1 Uncharacterised protein [Salmonella enterica subsp. enterica serovar Bovismorbificans]
MQLFIIGNYPGSLNLQSVGKMFGIKAPDTLKLKKIGVSLVLNNKRQFGQT